MLAHSNMPQPGRRYEKEGIRSPLRERGQTSSAPLSAPTARVFPSLVAVQRLLFSYPLESVSCIMNIIICLYFEMTNSDITAATMCNTALWLAG
jgi:hypothetical protein